MLSDEAIVWRDDLEARGAFNPASVGRWISKHPLAIALIVAEILALLSEMPWVSRPVRAIILRSLIMGFFAFVGGAGEAVENLKKALLRGPNPFIVALLLWCIYSALLPLIGGVPFGRRIEPFAIPEVLRMVFCIGVFWTAAYALRARDLRPVVVGVMTMGLLVALYGLIRFGDSGHRQMELISIFGNHEQVGSYLMLMLPVAAAFALDKSGDTKLMLAAQVTAVVLAGALLLTRTRSAWIGESVGLIMLIVLFLWKNPVKFSLQNKSALIGPSVILVIGVAMLMFSSQLAPLLSQRAATMTSALSDASLSDRMHRWGAACRMAHDRPITGWGLGTFPVLQQNWTGTGDDSLVVLAHGTGHTNLAHNFWVQWQAETGAVGQFLYVAVLIAFFACVIRRLPDLQPGFRRSLAIGCIAATAAACGDMVGSPSYTFPGVSSIPWLWMGLAVAACRPEKRSRSDAPEALPANPAWVWIVSAVTGILVAGTILWIGGRQVPLTDEQRNSVPDLLVPLGEPPPRER